MLIIKTVKIRSTKHHFFCNNLIFQSQAPKVFIMENIRTVLNFIAIYLLLILFPQLVLLTLLPQLLQCLVFLKISILP